MAYLTGYPDGTFGPNRSMTRAEVAQMFYALLLDQDVKLTDVYKRQVHNRAGEAEKAHLKAGQAGWREKWTVIYLVGLQHKQADKLLTESPSTDKWFDINEVCAQSGKTYDSFKNMLVSRFGLIVNSICDV